MNSNMASPPTVSRKSISAKAQRDLFQLDSPPIDKIRGKRSLMKLLFLALAKSAWMKPPSYEQGPVSIKVPPSGKGIATIYDKEIVIYIARLMAAEIKVSEEDEPASQSLHDIAYPASQSDGCELPAGGANEGRWA